MTILASATPRSASLDPKLAALIRALATGMPGIASPSGSRIELQYRASGASDAAASAQRCRDLEATLRSASTLHEVSFDFAAEGQPADFASDATPSAGVRWTPESAGLRDLNGTGARAAFPKVWSACAARRGATAVTRVTSVENERVVIASGRFRDLSAGPEAVTRGAIAEAGRLLACAGAWPELTALSWRFAAIVDTSTFRRCHESTLALVETANVFRVPIALDLEVANELAAGAVELRVAMAGGIQPSNVLADTRKRFAGERLMLLGEAPVDLRGSVFVSAVHGAEASGAPEVDPLRERRLTEVLRTLGKAGVLTAAKSIGCGGVMAAIGEMLLEVDLALGVRVDLTSLGGVRADALLFGEDPGRVLVATSADRVGTILSEAHMRGVPAALIGEFADDPVLSLKTRSLATEWPLASLRVT